MPVSKCSFAALTAGFLSLASTLAFADAREKLAGAQIDAYLKGNTIYVDIVAGGPFGDGGETPFYYGHDGTFAAQMPNGKITGTWKISETASYCIDITEHGRTYCTDVFKQTGRIEHHSVGLKRLMGPVLRIVPGNDAKL